MWLAGADACRGGWVRAVRDPRSGALEVRLVEEAEALLRGPRRIALLGLDIPIGLPEAGPRCCDREARRHLGRPRASSVFPAPIRPALPARSRAEADRITRDRDGRGVGAQAFGIQAKVREVDTWLLASPSARRRVREVHPELAFQAWNRGRALAAGKRTPEGRRARLRLAEAWLGRGILTRARGDAPRSAVADDDLLDALAVLWSTHRIARGEARTLPAKPPRDARGLPMRILF